ncbi:FKH2 [Enterospora canceri]|uniref:FKH2 n=1 Tax=Enterospora canceri TaxID=1081671 RepID=A0A1Y1S7Q3_9MICR|nr:FKH2 [Enterospora canceri]
MFFDCEHVNEPENKKNSIRNEQFDEIFKIPSVDNYMELCQILMDKEERKEYVNPVFDTFMTPYEPITQPQYSTGYYTPGEPSHYRGQTEETDKPDDSYAYMILRALNSSENNMMTLNEIYTWIEEEYPYFKRANAIWKNSIRHNLSLNAAFKKNPRQSNQRGKGGFWSIVEDKEIVRKINRKRRITRSYTHHNLKNDCYDEANNTF